MGRTEGGGLNKLVHKGSLRGMGVCMSMFLVAAPFSWESKYICCGLLAGGILSVSGQHLKRLKEHEHVSLLVFLTHLIRQPKFNHRTLCGSFVVLDSFFKAPP